MTFIDELHESIERRLQELRAEITKIEDARRALANGSVKDARPAANGSAKAAPTQPQPADVKPRRRRQKTQVLTVERLLPILAGSADGLSTAAIA